MKKVRNYENYNNYLDHQKEKTLDPKRREKWLNEEWQLKVDGFEKSFHPHRKYINKSKALCIGARTGQEVAVLNKMGADAIGIDICPCPPYVIEGDMHDLPFDDKSFDFVFSNVLDHSIYPEKKINEIERVLKVGGKALLHLQVDIPSDIYTETEVKNVSLDILPLFKKSFCLEMSKLNNPVFATMNKKIIMEKTSTDLDITVESLARDYFCKTFVQIDNTKNSSFSYYLRDNNIDENVWYCDLSGKNDSKKLSSTLSASTAKIDMFYIDAVRNRGEIIRDIYHLKEHQSENPIWVFANLKSSSGCYYDIISIMDIADKFKIHLEKKEPGGELIYHLMVLGKF